MSGHTGGTEVGGRILPESLPAGLRILALRALGNEDDAADAVQETLTRAIAAVREDRVPSETPLTAYVYGIARHVIADVLRARARERGSRNPRNLATTAPSPLEALVRKEERQRVRRALTQLTERDRALLRRCYVEGDRLVDIARRQGEPAERVRKRKSRALARLREELETSPAGHVPDENPTDRV